MDQQYAKVLSNARDTMAKWMGHVNTLQYYWYVPARLDEVTPETVAEIMKLSKDFYTELRESADILVAEVERGHPEELLVNLADATVGACAEAMEGYAALWTHTRKSRIKAAT